MVCDNCVRNYRKKTTPYKHIWQCSNYLENGKDEYLIKTMSSLAQEENRSISENITWGQRKSFSDGKVHIRYINFLGFKKGANGKPEIIEEEAKTVRKIYELFIKGRRTASWIAKHLTESGIKTPGGKDKWQKSIVSLLMESIKEMPYSKKRY